MEKISTKRNNYFSHEIYSYVSNIYTILKRCNTSFLEDKVIYKQKTQRFNINNTLEQFKIYKHHKIHKNEILNDQITYNDHIQGQGEEF